MIWILWIFIISLVFDKFAYYIDNFNAKIRILITKGSSKLRTFDENGIPYSFNPRIKDKFISPFYVVHYGLLYSQVYKESLDNLSKERYIWKLDSTLPLWNIPPKRTSKSVEREYFINSARWVVKNLKKFNRHYHLIYDFEWQYKGYPGGKLTPPWYSGLTDSYAIILLLRAYEITKDYIYIDAAKKLYETVTTTIDNGGDLNYLNGLPWIEEYIDPKVTDYNKLSYVLNGMIYAFYGVLAYEDYFQIRDGLSKKLSLSIYNSIDKYNMSNRWSLYDLIGGVANIKYHRIHIGLLEELVFINGNFQLPVDKFRKLYWGWKRGLSHPGFYLVVFGNKTIGYFHFLAEYILLLILPMVFIVGVKKWR